MRIQQSLKSSIAQEKSVRIQTSRQAHFQEMLNRSQKQLHQENMSHLLRQIEDQGKQLAERRTIENLKQYKKLVQQILEEAVRQGLSLAEKQGPVRGRPKGYRLGEHIDQKLIQLAEDVLNEERTRLDILSLVGEIQGLLINLYA